MEELFCNFDGHQQKSIINICLNRNCYKRKVCEHCLKQFHMQHFLDCVRPEFIETILLNEENKQETILNNFKGHLSPNFQKDQLILSSIQKQCDLVKQYRKNVQQKQLINQNELYELSSKCYNALTMDELQNIIICHFKEEDEKPKKESLLKIINQQNDTENIDYLSKKLYQKGKQLQIHKLYKETIIMYDASLLVKQLPEVMMNKAYCLKQLGRQEEGFILEIEALNLGQKIGVSPLDLLNCLNHRDYDWEVWKALTYYSFGQYHECINCVQRMNLNRISNDEYCDSIQAYSYSLIHLKKFQEAIKVCEEGLERLPGNKLLVKIKNAILKYINRNSEGLFEIDAPGDDQLQMLKGIYLLKESKIDEAMKQFDSVQTKNEAFKEQILFAKGLTLINEGKIQEGLKFYEQVQFKDHDYMQKHTKCLKSKFNVVFTQVALQQPDEAIKTAEEMIDSQPNNKLFWFMKSLILFQTFRQSEAIECIDVALGYHPQNVQLTFIKATYLAMTFQLDEALKLVNFVLEKNYITFETLELKAKILIHLGQFDQTLQISKQLCINYPTVPDGFYIKGVMLLCQLDFESAIKDFDKVISMDSTFQAAFLNKGLALVQLQKHKEALQVYKQIFLFQKSKLYYIDNLYTLQYYDEALRLIKETPKGQKYYRRCQVYLFKILFLNGKYTEAWDAIKLVDETKFRKVFTFQIITLIKQKKRNEAVAIINKLASQKSELSLALYYKGYLLEHENTLHQALECYTKALRIEYSPQIMKAKIDLLQKLQRKNESIELQESFLNIFPNQNFDLDLQFDITFKTEYKKTFTGLNFRLDDRKLGHELQIY